MAGIPEIINSIVGRRRKFTAYISKDPIPNYTGHLKKTKAPSVKKGRQMLSDVEIEEEGLSNGWYELKGTGQVGWLCPATLKYFEDYPDNIYFRIE